MFYFEGSAIEILYSRGPEGGDFYISLDDITWPQFNGYAEQYLYGTSIQQFNIAPGIHQLVITNDDGALWIEAIRVYGSLFDTSVEWGLLIEDNFDDGNFSYWMSDGQLDYMLVEHDLGQAVSFASGQMMRLETGGYRNMVLVASVLVEQGVAEFSIRASENGHYYLQFFSDGTLSFYRNETLLGTASIMLTPDTWYEIRLEAIENIFTVFVNNTETIHAFDPHALPLGTIAIVADALTENRFILDDFELWLPVGELSSSPLSVQTLPTATPLAAGLNQTSDAGDLIYECRAYNPIYGYIWGSLCIKSVFANGYDYFSSNGTPLTRAGGPSWSPDGEWVSFSVFGGFSLPQEQDIVVTKRDHSERRKFDNYPIYWEAHSPAWSPDGTKIAFVSDETTRNGSAAIYVVNSGCTYLSCSKTKLVADGIDTTHDESPDWSRDSQEITFHSNRSGTYGIYRVNAAGGTPTYITEGKYPVWSPMADEIAFVKKNASGTNSVYVINLNNQQIRQITNPGSGFTDEVSDWSPDGSQLIFHRVNVLGNAMYTMYVVNASSDVASNEMSKIAVGLGRSPKWHGDPCCQPPITPVPTLTPTSTTVTIVPPTMPPQTQCLLQVNTELLNLRGDASGNNPAIAKLPQGTELRAIFESGIPAYSIGWWHVEITDIVPVATPEGTATSEAGIGQVGQIGFVYEGDDPNNSYVVPLTPDSCNSIKFPPTATYTPTASPTITPTSSPSASPSMTPTVTMIPECTDPNDIVCWIRFYHVTKVLSELGEIDANGQIIISATDAYSLVDTTDWAAITIEWDMSYGSGASAIMMNMIQSKDLTFFGPWKAKEIYDVVRHSNDIERVLQVSPYITQNYPAFTISRINYVKFADDSEATDDFNCDDAYNKRGSLEEARRINSLLQNKLRNKTRPSSFGSGNFNAVTVWGEPFFFMKFESCNERTSWQLDGFEDPTKRGYLIFVHELGHYVDTWGLNSGSIPWSDNAQNVAAWGWGNGHVPVWVEKHNAGVPSTYALKSAQEDFAETFSVAIYVFLHADDNLYVIDPVWKDIYGDIQVGLFIPGPAHRCSMEQFFGLTWEYNGIPGCTPQ